jgi:Na+/H+ antiporter NhaD/arsenite permease-like protein
MLFEKQIKVEIPVIVITAALLIIYRMKKHDVKTLIKNEIEWETLLFLMGLFIIIGTLGDLHIINSISNKIVYYSKGNIRVLSCVILWISGIFSPLIDNIPLVTAMIPMIQNINYQIGNTVYAFWWSLILGVGFGTNGTLLGGYANIIASDIAKKNNHPISFWTFFRYGSIITLFNLILSTIFILFIL